MIRPATADDLPALVELVESAYRGDRSRAGWTTEADLIDGQRMDPTMMAALLADATVEVLVAADHAGRVVACCELRPPDTPGDTAHFAMFAVSPGEQGRGTGSRLLGEAEVRAAAAGASAIELWVIDVRADLIAWYGRRGYRPTGDHHPFPYGDERFGRPRRADLRFAVLSKPLAPRAEHG